MDVMPPELADWMVPADAAILDLLDSGLALSTKVMAVNTSYDRHYVSTRTRQLKAAGLVYKNKTGLYTVTPYGRQYLDGTVDPESIGPGPPSTYSGYRRSDKRDAVFADDVPLFDRLAFHELEIDDVTWGYPGGGPQQLAFCLLADVADTATAEAHDVACMHEFVVDFDDEWTLAADKVRSFVASLED